MDSALKTVRPLPGYRLEVTFQNGSMAIVNMEQRVKTLRFSRLSSEDTFSTARAEGDKVVWNDKGMTLSFYCNELLDAMMMD